MKVIKRSWFVSTLRWGKHLEYNCVLPNMRNFFCSEKKLRKIFVKGLGIFFPSKLRRSLLIWIWPGALSALISPTLRVLLPPLEIHYPQLEVTFQIAFLPPFCWKTDPHNAFKTITDFNFAHPPEPFQRNIRKSLFQHLMCFARFSEVVLVLKSLQAALQYLVFFCRIPQLCCRFWFFIFQLVSSIA